MMVGQCAPILGLEYVERRRKRKMSDTKTWLFYSAALLVSHLFFWLCTWVVAFCEGW